MKTNYKEESRKAREFSRKIRDNFSEQHRIAAKLYRRWMKNNSLPKVFYSL